MFDDEVKIYVKAGDGGSGVIAFRREKYVPKGGPSGGDGGKGGNVYLIADPALFTLSDFKFHRHYKAERGKDGQGKNKTGDSASDLILRVPVGTVVYDAQTDKVLKDLSTAGQRFLVARGGRGGKGNAHFSSSKNRAPRIAEKGEPGEEKWLKLELKLIADIGLVGLPNAGKSSILAALTSARPKIDSYPFTTLNPNLGVAFVEDKRFVLADIPGLISGAHRGEGLGHKFLRHIERTRVLAYILDCGSSGGDVVEDWKALQQELKLYNPDLVKRPSVVLANKMDLTGAEENYKRLLDYLSPEFMVLPTSALTGEGLEEVKKYLLELLAAAPPISVVAEEENEAAEEDALTPLFSVTREQNGYYTVKGREIEKKIAMTLFESEEAVLRLTRYLKESGVEDALRQNGIKTGDTVKINGQEFYWEE